MSILAPSVKINCPYCGHSQYFYAKDKEASAGHALVKCRVRGFLDAEDKDGCGADFVVFWEAKVEATAHRIEGREQPSEAERYADL